MMKAIVYTKYGPPDVLQLKDVEKPAPNTRDVLIKVRAVAVTSGDCKARGFKDIHSLFWIPSRVAFGIIKPRNTILGSELAGEVEAIGQDVSRFSKGDRVFGYTGLRFGAYAEYLCLPEDSVLAIKPANTTFEEAASVPFGSITALFFLRKGNIQNGQHVLINGASGAVGSAAVQLAKYFGAEVTGVCSTEKLNLVRSLGADRVIDYTKEDFTKIAGAYDIIFDTVGASSYADCRDLLKQDGRYLLAVFGFKQLLQMLWTSIFGSKKVICAISTERVEDLNFLTDLIEAGKMRSVIDRRYPLEQAADAHRYVEEGHKTGSVILTLERNRETQERRR